MMADKQPTKQPVDQTSQPANKTTSPPTKQTNTHWQTSPWMDVIDMRSKWRVSWPDLDWPDGFACCNRIQLLLIVTLAPTPCQCYHLYFSCPTHSLTHSMASLLFHCCSLLGQLVNGFALAHNECMVAKHDRQLPPPLTANSIAKGKPSKGRRGEWRIGEERAGRRGRQRSRMMWWGRTRRRQ